MCGRYWNGRQYLAVACPGLRSKGLGDPSPSQSIAEETDQNS